MTGIRKPAVAGRFYPSDPAELRAAVRGFLDAADVVGPAPKAIIAPHAGYVYSGPVAASAYRLLEGARDHVSRVVLLGPAHRARFDGLALHSAEAFATPLGIVPVDRAAVARIAHLPQVVVLDEAHDMEHSLEVQLPFLQEALGSFSLVPLAVGDATPAEVDEVLEALWGGPETLLVVSSDLSHYYDYDTARALDERTSRAIEGLRFEDIRGGDACGRVPITGLLSAARRRGLRAETIDLRSSGDTAGPRGQVVGYGAYVFR
jgi:AmmeMemoRadiSam system protein B